MAEAKGYHSPDFYALYSLGFFRVPPAAFRGPMRGLIWKAVQPHREGSLCRLIVRTKTSR
jgi:hypothetical protein